MPLDDTNWPKPEIYSLDGLIAWLRRQPRDREYDYTLPQSCLATQYFEQFGIQRQRGNQYGRHNLLDYPLLDMHYVVSTKPWTFGAALDRAIALARSREVVG